MSADLETTTRARLRALRTQRGWSLDDLASRAGLSASTVSRIETGKRTIGLDVLVPLTRALGVRLDALVADDDDGDVVIRPSASTWGPGTTVWPLSRPGAATAAVKVRLEPTKHATEPRVHPGHDWLFVLSGTVELTLGERRLTVGTGEAAEFSTMNPHAVVALGGPAELIMVFDREGQRSHLAHHHGGE